MVHALAWTKGVTRSMTDTDNVQTLPADAHGHAALLLVEALIHGLCEKDVLNRNDAIDIVDSAASVQLDVSDAATASLISMRQAHALLVAIARSFQIDQVT
jgi:hypothetical protein